MTNEAHIRDEDLELYALGPLSDPEAAPVRQRVEICSACSAKLAKARGNAALLAFSVEQEIPSPAAKEKLFARIAAEPGANPVLVLREDNQRRMSWWNWVFVPATLILAILSLALWRQNIQLFANCVTPSGLLPTLNGNACTYKRWPMR